MKSRARYSREWRKRNPTKAAEYNRRFRKRHPEVMERQRKRQRDSYIKKGRYRVSIEHKKKIHREYVKRWRLKNPQKVKDTARRTYLKMKGTLSWKIHKRNYKARKRSGDDKTISPKALVELLEKQNNICAIGGEAIGELKELDHKTPISKGGRHTLENVQWVCRFHNRSKGNKII